MTKKPTLTSITSGFASNTQLNDNFEKIRTAFDNTLSLDGSTPNAMNADLDLNGNNINNVDTLDVLTELTLNGQVVTSIATVPNWKGEWVTARAYVLNDLVRYNGATYIVKVAYTSGTFSVDQAAGKLEVFAEKGSSGAGTGDMLTTNNLSDLTNKPQAIVNLGINATAAELNYVDGVTSNVQTQLDSKATLASPALTGTPTAPTASAGTNTTQVATTAFVTTAIANDTSKYNEQIFTASGTWTKPASAPSTALVRVQMWAGGGSGGRGDSTNTNASGGGGGGFAEFTVLASSLGATQAVTVGAGGAATTGTTQTGNAGGFSDFAGARVYGGRGGPRGGSSGNRDGSIGGNSSGLFNNNANGGGYAPDGGTEIAPDQFGGGGGSNTGGTTTVGAFMGGGGGKSSINNGVSTSVFGGAGGNANTAGTAPAGGGGGAAFSGSNSGAGARGEVRIYTTW